MSQKQETALSQELANHLRSIVDERVQSDACPSVSATLFRGARDLMTFAAGEARIGGVSPGPETVYRIASCTKSFIVVALLILRDRGLVSLDSPITDFVPEFRQAPLGARFEPPTIRMLMAMSGGLPTDDPWADRQESISNQELREVVARGVLVTTAPGTRFQYSNLGYALLGQVIEAVSGRSFRDVVTEEVLSPLGLHETGFAQGVVAPEQLALGYRRRDAEWVELEFAGPGAFSCIGGLFASNRNLASWAKWLSSCVGDDPDASGPLSVASRREMQQVVTAMPFNTTMAPLARDAERQFGYGLGLICEYDRRFGQFVSHSGGYPGYSSHMRWHLGSGLGVVVMENARYSGAWKTASDIIDTVLDEWGFEASPIAPWPETLELARKADALVRQWSDQLANKIFEVNVNQDVPLAERRESISRYADDLGGLSGPSSFELGTLSDSAQHLIWMIPAARGALKCEIRLSPKYPSLIQTLNVSIEPRR